MRRLLEERTWCGNYVTKRSARNSNCSSNCCLFCAKDGPIRWKTTKNFGWVSIRAFHRALYWLVLDELKWLWLLAEFPGAHWRPFQAAVVVLSDRNVPLMSGMHDFMFHNFAVIFSWLCVLRGNHWATRTEARFFSLLYWMAHIGGRQSRFWRGWLIKVILQIPSHRIISTWPTPYSAEPASCPGYVKFSFVSFCIVIFMVSWSVLQVCWLSSPMEWLWGEQDQACWCCAGPASLDPNTSSALSCKYHQQLVAHELVVLNKLLAYM